MRRLLTLLAALVAVLSLAPAQEVQAYGRVFEKWVRDTFFAGYRPASHTQRWDIPATENKDHGAIPVNFRLAKLGTAVDLGAALRQYEIDEPFMLIIGFWQQEGEVKRMVNLIPPEVSPELWRKLWGPVTYADLLRLDAVIKDTGPAIEETRRLALQLKNAPPFNQAIIQVNPKIDDLGQRRLLCSLRSRDVFQYLAPGAAPKPQEHPALFGVEYPGPGAPKPPELKKT